MQKILIVINTLAVGGAERLVVDQVNYLERSGYTVDVLTLLPRTKPGFYKNLVFSTGKLLGIDTHGFSIQGIISIYGIIKEGKYDVIISHLFLANTLTRIARLFSFSDSKMVVYEHNVYSKEKKTKHLMMDYILSFFTYKIIAVSDLVADYLVKHKIPKKKIIVIRNGISDDFTKKDFSPARLRQELGFRESDFVIVSVGNVNPQKGYETLIEASERVIQKHPNIHFVICGSDTSSYADSLKNMTKKTKTDTNVHFLGARLDAIDIMQCSDVFLMTSLWEGLSISLLEALMLGKLIIVSKIPSLMVLISDRHNGFSFELNNSKQLVEIISDVFENREKYGGCKENAKLTGNQYTIDSNIKRILSLVN